MPDCIITGRLADVLICCTAGSQGFLVYFRANGRTAGSSSHPAGSFPDGRAALEQPPGRAAGWVCGLVVAFLAFGLNGQVLWVSQVKGLLLTLNVVFTLWPGIFIYHLVDQLGGIRAISAALEGMVHERGWLLVLQAWMLSAIIESLAGFGLPIAMGGATDDPAGGCAHSGGGCRGGRARLGEQHGGYGALAAPAFGYHPLPCW